MLRLNRPVGKSVVATLNAEFGDIVTTGVIEESEATSAEVRDNDHPDLPRLVLSFDNRSFARLMMLIRRINELAGAHGAPATEGLVHDLEPEPDEY